ncbi:hypothetical protein WMF30_10245 [Sorangium sp. So ce134]
MGSSTMLPGTWDEYPRCAQCARPVERFLADHDLVASEYILVAACHGETQTVRVTEVEAMAGFCIGEALADAPELPPRSTPLLAGQAVADG